MGILLKESPYNLFKSLESIYLLDRASIGYGKELLDQIIVPIDKVKFNKLIYDNVQYLLLKLLSLYYLLLFY